MKPIYAARIREVRQGTGLTQTEFAKIIGTTKNQLSKYETSVQDVPTKVIISVCENFKVDANWLMDIGEVQVKPDYAKLRQLGIAPPKSMNTFTEVVKIKETDFKK